MKTLSNLRSRPKGFRPELAGCTEHCATANLIIDDAVRLKKDLFVIALDFKDAFGSVPHDLLRYTLEKTGFYGAMTGVVSDSYNKSWTEIRTGKGTSERIEIGKGVKQGCTLSRILFNMSIDPMLRRLSRFKRELGYEYGKFGETEFKIVQAYTDGVLLFARSREGLEKILELVKEFLEFTGIRLNPKKCTAFKYGRGDKYVTNVQLKDVDTGNVTILPWIEDNDVFKYLGIPLGKKKTGKLEYSHSLFNKVDLLLDRLEKSGLKISQIINAVKMFVLPKFD
jgi:hypothetical protein